MSQLVLIALIIAAAVAAGFGSGWKLRDLSADAELGELQAMHAQREAAWERAARESMDLQRQIETTRRAAVLKEAEDAQRDAAMDAKRAADLRAANGRLLDHVARLAAYADQGCRDPAAAAGSEAATGPGLVLANLYRGADQEAHDLAAAFDASRRAGLTCERVYASLMRGDATGKH